MASGWGNLSSFQVNKPSLSSSLTSSTSTTTLGGVHNGNGSENLNLKDEQLPDGLNQLVIQLRDYIKKQKAIKDEIERQSIKSSMKVHDETDKLRKDVSLVSSVIQKDASVVESIKHEMSQELINAEIAQLTSTTPVAFQHENLAPQEYFKRLIQSFEERMFLYRRQVEEVESHLASLQQPQTISPQEISIMMKKLHKTFITLAARMHATHEVVKAEKERYIAYRKRVFGDTSDIFRQNDLISVPQSYLLNDLSLRSNIGPSPFAHCSSSNKSLLATPLQAGVSVPAMSSGFGLGNTSSLNGNTSAFGGLSFGASNPTPFGKTTTGFAATAGGLGSSGFGTSSTFGSTSGFGLTNSALGKSIGSSGFGGLGTNTMTANTLSTGFGNTTNSFQLNKPPLSSKRGKK